MKNKLLWLLTAGFLMPSCLFAQQTMKTTDAMKKIPDYSTTERSAIPDGFKWKIEDIYPTMDDWKADREKLQKMIDQIGSFSKDWTSSPQKMLSMLEFQDQLGKIGIKLWSYCSHQSNVDLGNPKWQSLKGDMQAMFVSLSAKVSFINPDILALGQEKFGQYLKTEPALEKYRFGIENTFRTKDHILPEEQQKIVSLTGLFGNTPSRASGMLNNLEIPPKEVMLIDGETVTLTAANLQRYRASKNPSDRELVMTTFYDNQKKYENTQAILLDGGIQQDYFSATVSKFPDCLSARLFDDNISTDVYYNLITSVKDNLDPLNRYFRLKANLLGLAKFRYCDMYASVVPGINKSYTFDEARQIILEMAKPLGKDYTDALSKAFTESWIDIYPNKGKESGAYSGGCYGVHPYVKMNFNGKYNDVSTLAHELGHAMHSYFSGIAQPYTTSSYPTFLAEIASTFNENLLMQYLLMSDADDLFKLFILDNYLEQLRGTIYVQTMYADFDLSIHKRVESGKSLTPDWLDNEFLGTTRSYLGHDKGVVDVGDYIQCGWSRIPHFYRNFYVFQYSTGMIASLALSQMVLKGGEEEKNHYLTMLKAGGSDYPIEILKKAGVDMNTKAPYTAAFNRFNDLVGEMEKLVARLKQQKKL